jgi:hypothetical protein
MCWQNNIPAMPIAGLRAESRFNEEEDHENAALAFLAHSWCFNCSQNRFASASFLVSELKRIGLYRLLASK